MSVSTVQGLAKMELRVSPRLLDSLASVALLKISEFNPQACCASELSGQ